MAQAERQGWKIVCRAMGLLPAEAIQGRLATAGIPAVLDYDGVSRMLGIPIYAGTGEVRILVPIERLAEARELLGPEADDEAEDDAE